MGVSVKTAISMQEDLFKKVNKMAKDLKVSRSKLFVLAVQDFIRKQENQKLLLQINKVYSDAPDLEEEKIQKGMRKKHTAHLEREAW
jgi:metal-responsive CopG/Arc/MetJ family transcriptional regulator